MKIINIVPGFGGTFYCGNCLRDSVLVKTLRSSGHDSVTLPIYLPLTTAGNPIQTDTPVFYGAVNIYLKQNYPLFRHMPLWLEHIFDLGPVLRFAASKAGSTRASGLDEMTISMLRGSEGFQNEELQQLINYLKHHEKPDVVHLSNALLLGLAEKLKTELNTKVVCSLQDEDQWVDAMTPAYREKIWKLMAEKARYVDAFIAVSDFYAGVMKKNMNLPDEKVHTIHIGVDPSVYKVFSPSLNPPTIGYLSRMCEENGLGILIDAFIELKGKKGFEDARLRLTGGMTGDDKRFINKQLRKLKNKNLLKDVEFMHEFRPETLDVFFDGLSVLSVPVLAGEAFGLYQMESLSSGIPVIQPSLGAFPEIIKITGGGKTYSPNNGKTLADALAEVLGNPSLLEQMSRNGRASVENHFNNQILTDKMIRVYEQITSGKT
jgi:glycosyltransferase involved in cell wall biosynthesis